MNRTAVDSPEQQAEKTINERYHQLQAEVTTTVRHKLLARKMHIDESDLEESYCQAWHGVYERIKQRKQISNLTGMLVEITWRRAVDTYRELHPSQQAALDVEEPITVLDLDAQLDDRIKFKRFIAQVRRNLNPRECEAVSLCVIHGYPRAEAARIMGLQRRQIEKLMDGATKKIGGIAASIAGRGCGSEEWARLMRSYALGVIAEDDRDYPRAAKHVAQCAACNRYVNGLRGLTAILPPGLPVGPLVVTGHNNGIVSYLERLFRVGHTTGGRIAGGEGALRSGESAGGLAGTLGTATIAKGVAVVVAGAAALTIATHDQKAHVHAHQPSPATTQSQTPPGAVASATPPVLLRSPSMTPIGVNATHTHIHTRSLARRTHALATRPSQRNSQRSPSQAAQATRNTISESTSSTPTPPTHAQPGKENANAIAVNKEFGWER